MIDPIQLAARIKAIEAELEILRNVEMTDNVTLTSGAPWLNGSGTPSSGLGSNGDYYLDVDNGDLYYKASGSWSIVYNVKGSKGDKGDTGPAGPKGDTGSAGGAPTDSQYLTLATDGDLSAERVFTPSAPLNATDNGAGSTYVLGVDAATEAAAGKAEIATQTETNTGADDARYVTPLKLKSVPLNHLKVSKLRESDDSADAVTVDADGDVTFETGRAFFLDSATRAPFNLVARSAAPSSPSTDDIYLDDGTNTGAGAPAYFWYNGSSWVEISPAPVAATETVAGKAEIATSAEVAGAVDDQRIVTPLKLSGVPLDHFRVSELRESDDGGTALSADAAGDLTASGTLTYADKKFSFSVVRDGTNQSISDSTFTKIQFVTEEFDPAGAFDSSTNYRFQPTVAGYYQINLTAMMLSVADGTLLIGAIYKNGSLFKQGRATAGAATNTSVNVGAVIQFNGSTDYIEGFIWHNHGTSRDLSGAASHTHMSGFLETPS